MDYAFEWDRILFNGLPGHFLFEVVLRSSVMFITLLIVLTLTGKRGVKQLSVFETVIIIALGSAAGDPMFYEDVGIVPAVTVFVIVLLLYRAVTWLTGKSPWFERLVEGKTECLIIDGKFSFSKFDRESLAQDEFFTELRLKSVEHLGQVRRAYIETTGDVSIFFYEDEDVKDGLPIVTELFCEKTKVIADSGLYACSKCADVQKLSVGEKRCEVCENTEWVKTIKTRRIT
ncbi:hypothetical protein CNR22_19260 [Sphingobacteriaceae bacterium]|nr:hypothetical protein CNR22_19260 [Sphingobacteriaceae bacterium]